MNIGQLLVTLGVDTKGLNKAAMEMEAFAEKATDQQRKLNAFLNKSTKAQTELTQEVEKGGTSWLTAGKMIGMWGTIAAGAMAVTIKAMKSTGDTTDALERELDGLRAGLDFVNISLATGDWQNFIAHLVQSTTAAKDLYDALDEIGNIRRSLTIQEAKNLTQLTQLAEVFRDRTGKFGITQRQDAFLQWRSIRTEDTQKFAETAKRLASAKLNNYAAQTGLTSAQLRDIVENYSKYAVNLERVRKELESVGGGNAQRAFVNFLSGSDKALGKLLLGFGKLTDEKLDDLSKALTEQYVASAKVEAVNLENIRTYNDIFKVVKDGAGKSTAEIGTLIKVMDQMAVSGRTAQEAFSTAPKTSLLKAGKSSPNIESMNNFIDQDYMRMQDALNRKMKIYNDLASNAVSIGQMWGDVINGNQKAYQALGSTVLMVAQQIIEAEMAKAAATMVSTSATLAEKAIAKNGYIGLIVAAAGISALMAMMSGAKKQASGVAHMAHGGTVPAGYPNDTFPAMLTSGEKVIPAGSKNEQPIKLQGQWELDGRKLRQCIKNTDEYLDQVI